MARNSPGAVRARAPRRSEAGAKVRPIDGMSSRANAAIVRLQTQRPDVGRVGDALRYYRRMVLRPGRWAELSSDRCPCPGCDFSDERDVLEAALHLLPAQAARELRRMVCALDEVFLRKTLPDPAATSRTAWWRRRVDGS